MEGNIILNNKKGIDIEYFIISFMLLASFMFLLSLWWLDDDSVQSNEPIHQCTTFIKYQEHYMITPMTWGYRESFKCVECGKDYKD